MTVPDDAGLMPERRRSAALRAARQARFTEVTALLKARTGDPASAVMFETFDIAAGTPGERKAQADQIARQMGAVTEWWNGYYMATATISGQPVEIHFNPPIFDPEMTGCESGDGA
jgi:hypothetical protein